jgi:hypothetical protein
MSLNQSKKVQNLPVLQIDKSGIRLFLERLDDEELDVVAVAVLLTF